MNSPALSMPTLWVSVPICIAGVDASDADALCIFFERVSPQAADAVVLLAFIGVVVVVSLATLVGPKLLAKASRAVSGGSQHRPAPSVPRSRCTLAPSSKLLISHVGQCWRIACDGSDAGYRTTAPQHGHWNNALDGAGPRPRGAGSRFHCRRLSTSMAIFAHTRSAAAPPGRCNCTFTSLDTGFVTAADPACIFAPCAPPLLLPTAPAGLPAVPPALCCFALFRMVRWSPSAGRLRRIGLIFERTSMPLLCALLRV